MSEFNKIKEWKVEQTIELTDKKIGNDARWYK